ncbi:MAG: hypothetical protein KBT34_06325 [Prevotella sp.]|nr:hypothetical protein [Candidatus Prevotella equi]
MRNRLLIVAALLCYFMVASSQTQMKFMGISFGSTATVFKQALAKKNCKFVSEETFAPGQKKWDFHGSFWELKQCKITLFDYKSNGKITSAYVTQDCYDYSMDQYNIMIHELIMDITSKYGKPTDTRIVQVVSNNVETYWKLKTGTIRIHYNNSKPVYVGIEYKSNLEYDIQFKEESNKRRKAKQDI